MGCDVGGAVGEDDGCGVGVGWFGGSVGCEVGGAVGDVEGRGSGDSDGRGECDGSGVGAGPTLTRTTAEAPLSPIPAM